MKIYQVLLAIDTGYEVINRTCILYAASEDVAGIMARDSFLSLIKSVFGFTSNSL